MPVAVLEKPSSGDSLAPGGDWPHPFFYKICPPSISDIYFLGLKSTHAVGKNFYFLCEVLGVLVRTQHPSFKVRSPNSHDHWQQNHPFTTAVPSLPSNKQLPFILRPSAQPNLMFSRDIKLLARSISKGQLGHSTASFRV